MTNLYRKSFQHAGLTLSYLDNQQPSPDSPIILLHGFTASAEINWRETGWINTLSQAGKRVIAIDARGHGCSDKPHNSSYYPAHVMMEDSIALLDQLNMSQAVYAGFSMGARMSSFAAIKHPERVEKLLIGGLGINLKNGIGNPEPIAAALRARDVATIKDRGSRRFRRIAEKYNNDLEAMACCISSSREPITDIMLQNISAQTLILVGNEDTTGGCPQLLKPYIRGSQAITIEQCNHFNALTHPDFNCQAWDFLTSSS